MIKKIIRMSILISSIMFFTPSFSKAIAKDWTLINPATIDKVLSSGYKLLQVTTDPESKNSFYRKYYHFVRYDNDGVGQLVICSVDIEFGTPKDEYCYMPPKNKD